MTVQEAIKEAMKRPISELNKISMERGPESLDKIVFGIGEDGDLEVNSLSNGGKNSAALTLEDLLADDWYVGLR